MKIKLLPLIFLLFSCKNQNDKILKEKYNKEDSLIKLIDSLKNSNEKNSDNDLKNSHNNETSKRKFVFVLISYIKSYKYYFEYEGEYKRIKEQDGNYDNGKWLNSLDTLTTMSSIREFDSYNIDLEYQLLDEVEKSLSLDTKKNEKDIDILKVNYRSAKTFDTYAEASKAQEDFKRKNENQRVQSLKDGGFKFNR